MTDVLIACATALGQLVKIVICQLENASAVQVSLAIVVTVVQAHSVKLQREAVKVRKWS